MECMCETEEEEPRTRPFVKKITLWKYVWISVSCRRSFLLVSKHLWLRGQWGGISETVNLLLTRFRRLCRKRGGAKDPAFYLSIITASTKPENRNFMQLQKNDTKLIKRNTIQIFSTENSAVQTENSQFIPHWMSVPNHS